MSDQMQDTGNTQGSDDTETTVVRAMTPAQAMSAGTGSPSPSAAASDTASGSARETAGKKDSDPEAGNGNDNDNDNNDDAALSSIALPGTASADAKESHMNDIRPADQDPTPFPGSPDTPDASGIADASGVGAPDGDGTQDPSFDAPKAEFTTAFDIIGQMGDVLDDAKTTLFNPSIVKIDRDDFQSYLDRLKKMLPVQLERASALMRQSEKKLSDARATSDTIIRQARSQAEKTVRTAQQQAEKTVRSAQQQAEEIVTNARKKADFLSGHEHVTEMARKKSADLIHDADARAARLADNSDAYSQKMLSELNQQLLKLTRDVQGGLRVLDQRRQQARTELEANRHDTLSGRGTQAHQAPGSPVQLRQPERPQDER